MADTAEQIPILIKLKQNIWQMDVYRRSTIQNVKNQIAKQLGITASHRLIFAGIILDNTKCVKDYNSIVPKSLVHIYIDPPKPVDPPTNTHYLKWTHLEFVDWIISMDDGAYAQYEHRLRLLFAEENVNGSVLYLISKSDLKEWGIHDFADRSKIYNRLQKLVNQQQENRVSDTGEKQKDEKKLNRKRKRDDGDVDNGKPCKRRRLDSHRSKSSRRGTPSECQPNQIEMEVKKQLDELHKIQSVGQDGLPVDEERNHDDDGDEDEPEPNPFAMIKNQTHLDAASGKNLLRQRSEVSSDESDQQRNTYATLNSHRSKTPHASLEEDDRRRRAEDDRRRREEADRRRRAEDDRRRREEDDRRRRAEDDRRRREEDDRRRRAEDDRRRREEADRRRRAEDDRRRREEADRRRRAEDDRRRREEDDRRRRAAQSAPIINAGGNNIINVGGVVNANNANNNGGVNAGANANIKHHCSNTYYADILCCGRSMACRNLNYGTLRLYIRTDIIVSHCMGEENIAHSIGCKCGYNITCPANCGQQVYKDSAVRLRAHIYERH
eukprot:498852_1